MADTDRRGTTGECAPERRDEEPENRAAEGRDTTETQEPWSHEGEESSLFLTLVHFFPVSVVITLIGLLIHWRFYLQLASWMMGQLNILIHGMYTSPIPEERGHDANFWTGIVVSLCTVAVLIVLMKLMLEDQVWRVITRIVFMADDGAQFQVMQRLLKRTLNGKLLVFLTKQLTMLLVWLFTPPVAFGRDVSTILYSIFSEPTHEIWGSTVVPPDLASNEFFLSRAMRLLLEKKLALLIYTSTAIYWWACQSGLLSLQASSARRRSLYRGKLRYLTPLTGYLRNRQTMSLLLMAFTLACMRVYEPISATGVDLISFVWLLVSRYPVAIIVFGLVCVIPSMLLGDWIQKRWGATFHSLMLLTAIHVFFVLYSMQVGKVIGMEIYTDSLRTNIEHDPAVNFSSSVDTGEMGWNVLWKPPSGQDANSLASHCGLDYTNSYTYCMDKLSREADVCNIVVATNASACLLNYQYHATEIPGRAIQLNLNLMLAILTRVLVIGALIYLCATAIHAFYTIYVSSPLLRCSWNVKEAKVQFNEVGGVLEPIQKLRDAVHTLIQETFHKEHHHQPSPQTASIRVDYGEGKTEENSDNASWWWSGISKAWEAFNSQVGWDAFWMLHNLHRVRGATENIVRKDTKISYSCSFQIPVENPTGRSLFIPKSEFEFNVVPEAVSLAELYENRRSLPNKKTPIRVSSSSSSSVRRPVNWISTTSTGRGVMSSMSKLDIPSALRHTFTFCFRALTRLGCDILSCIGVGLPGPLMRLLLWTSAKNPNSVWCLPFPINKTVATVTTSPISVEPGAHVAVGEATLTINIGSLLLVIGQSFKNMESLKAMRTSDSRLNKLLKQASSYLFDFSWLEEEIHSSWKIGGLAVVFNQSSQVLDWLSYRISLAALSNSSVMDAETVAITAINDPSGDAESPPLFLDSDGESNTRRWMSAFDRQISSLPSKEDVIRKYQKEIDQLTSTLQESRRSIPINSSAIDAPEFRELFEHFQVSLDSVAKKVEQTWKHIEEGSSPDALCIWIPLLVGVFRSTGIFVLVKNKADRLRKEDPENWQDISHLADNAVQQYVERMIELGYTIALVHFSSSLQGVSNHVSESDSPVHGLLIAALTFLAERAILEKGRDRELFHPGGNLLTLSGENSNSIANASGNEPPGEAEHRISTEENVSSEGESSAAHQNTSAAQTSTRIPFANTQEPRETNVDNDVGDIAATVCSPPAWDDNNYAGDPAHTLERYHTAEDSMDEQDSPRFSKSSPHAASQLDSAAYASCDDNNDRPNHLDGRNYSTQNSSEEQHAGSEKNTQAETETQSSIQAEVQGTAPEEEWAIQPRDSDSEEYASCGSEDEPDE